MSQGKPAGQPGPGERDIAHESYTVAERGVVFEHIAFTLASEAATAALERFSDNKNDITHIITTCTSGWVEPGIFSHLIHSLDLSLDTQKIELNFNGCFTGMACLRTARDIVRAGDANDRRVVLVVATEIASVQYSADPKEIADLIAFSLFADGSGAFIVAPEGDWRINDTGCSLVPDSAHLLSMKPHNINEPDRNCYYMGLHPKVSAELGTYFAEGNGSGLLQKLMDHCDSGTLPAVACHPGGPRILDALNENLLKRNFPSTVLQDSYTTLQENGNLGAAAVLFVMEKIFRSTEKKDVIGFAFGPGVTVEWGHFTRS